MLRARLGNLGLDFIYDDPPHIRREIGSPIPISLKSTISLSPLHLQATTKYKKDRSISNNQYISNKLAIARLESIKKDKGLSKLVDNIWLYF